jgi:hypothetical protein
LSQLVVASAPHTPVAYLDHPYRGPCFVELAAAGKEFVQPFLQPYDHQMFAVALPDLLVLGVVVRVF